MGDDRWGGKPRGSPSQGGDCQEGWLWLKWGVPGRAGLGGEGSPSLEDEGAGWPLWAGSLGNEEPVGEGRNYSLILELRES